MRDPMPSSVKLAITFLVFGTAWILFSDSLTLTITKHDLTAYNRAQNFKGVLFVLLSALLIWWVSRRLYGNIEKANREQEDVLQRFQVLGMATNEGIWDYNMTTGECYTNRALQEMFGYTADELQDNYRWWTNNLHPTDRERVLNSIDTKMDTGGKVWQDEYRFRCKDGQYKMIFDRGFIMRNVKGIPYRLIGAMQDVTGQRTLQAELLQTQVLHKEELAKSVLQAEEAARKKIGEELHDNINQLLGVVKLYIQHALVNPEMREELLIKSSSYIEQTIEEIRDLSRKLLPPALHEQTLVESLQQLAADIQQVKTIDIVIRHDAFNEDLLPDNKRLIIYRIIQEQLNNVLKHSDANQVTIKLMQCNNHVHLTIRDNGCGFDAEDHKPGMGLNNIRNRIEVFNGRMEINTSPGKGCMLEVEF
jgi:two-component system sensor histidine kinase UhpB